MLFFEVYVLSREDIENCVRQMRMFLYQFDNEKSLTMVNSFRF